MTMMIMKSKYGTEYFRLYEMTCIFCPNEIIKYHWNKEEISSVGFGISPSRPVASVQNIFSNFFFFFNSREEIEDEDDEHLEEEGL